MRKQRRWVSWSLEGSKKIPRSKGGSTASVTDPSTWGSFPEVKAAGRIGFVLGDGVGCWDFDGCIEGGVIDPWVIDFLSGKDILYTEVSQSGCGVHAFVPAAEAPGWRRTISGHKVEFYSRDRFIAMTGDRLML